MLRGVLMNYVFMIIMIFFFMLSVAVAVKCFACYVTSEVLSNTLCKTKFTKKMKQKTIIFGIASDLLAFFILPFIFTVLNRFGYSEFLEIENLNTSDYLYFLFNMAIYPDYSSISSDFNWFMNYFRPIIFLIVLSALIGVLLNYLFILRKSELSKKQKIIFLIIYAVATAPYYFLISFGNLADSLAGI